MSDNPYEKIANELSNAKDFGSVGFISRMVALGIDLLVLYGLIYLFGGTLFASNGSIGIEADTTGGIIAVIYYTALESSPLRGTIGKLLLGISVTDEFGEKLSILKSLTRTLTRAVTMLTLFLGYVFIFIREDKRALHDVMSGTYVVAKKDA
jgi:uncharacterized RDD family membrane protein YckC